MRKFGFYVNQEKHKKYTPKHCDPPKQLGIKWQLDVKYVPTGCYSDIDNQKFYQYTIIDEASRERFIYPYKEQSSYSTVVLLRELSSIFDINLKSSELIMVPNSLILLKPIEFILLISYVIFKYPT